jgi:hypothetical protein
MIGIGIAKDVKNCSVVVALFDPAFKTSLTDFPDNVFKPKQIYNNIKNQ